MKTALVSEPIVIDGIIRLPGITVTAEEVMLQPFVDLGLASWVVDEAAGATDSVAKPVLDLQAEAVPAPKAEDHAG